MTCRTLFVKQPWAWLIVHGHKPIENRSRRTHVRGPLLIGASAAMTRADYEACAIFCSGLPVELPFPSFDELRPQLGGIVGKVNLIDCVASHDSPWFVGPFGWVLSDAKPLPFQKCKGHQGFFFSQSTL